MHFDEVLEAVGGAGSYQALLFIFIATMEFLAGDAIQMNFMGYRVDSWCRVPRLANFSHAQQKYIAIPDDDDDDAECSVFDVDWDELTDEELIKWNRSEERATVACSEGWVHDRSEFTATVVTEWDLVCGDAWMVEMISTVYMAGRLVSALVCGPISDRFGRRYTAIGFHAIKVVGAIIASFASNYEAFVVGRCLMAVGSTGSNLAAYLIVAEICGKQHRARYAAMWSTTFSFSCCCVTLVAYFVRDFIKLQHVFTWPNLTMALYIFCLDESPRWLVSQGRDDEALVILRRVAAVNGRQLPRHVHFHEETTGQSKMADQPGTQEHRKGTILDLFRTPNIRKRTFVVWLTWFTCSLMFYGLSLNSGRLPGDVFVNTLLLSAVEIPSNVLCFYLTGRVGRKWTVGGSILAAGVMTYLCIPFLIYTHLETGATVLSVTGKALVTMAFTSVYIMTSEIVPTGIRNIAVGTASMWARVAGMAAPYVGGPLSDIESYLPSIVFGTLATLSALSVLLVIPETLNRRLPDTIEEAENFVEKRYEDGRPEQYFERTKMRQGSNDDDDDEDDVIDLTMFPRPRRHRRHLSQ